MVSLICGILKISQTHRVQKLLSGARGCWGTGGEARKRVQTFNYKMNKVRGSKV